MPNGTTGTELPRTTWSVNSFVLRPARAQMDSIILPAGILYYYRS